MPTYRAKERGYVDERIVEDGELFTTDAPKGSWMEDENEEEKPRRGRPPAAEKLLAQAPVVA
jgi:hypothetical protein